MSQGRASPTVLAAFLVAALVLAVAVQCVSSTNPSRSTQQLAVVHSDAPTGSQKNPQHDGQGAFGSETGTKTGTKTQLANSDMICSEADTSECSASTAAAANTPTDTETAKAKDIPVFVPTDEWQDILPGQAIPPGLHVAIDMQTGRKQAKLLDHGEADASANTNAVEGQRGNTISVVQEGSNIKVVDVDAPSANLTASAVEQEATLGDVKPDAGEFEEDSADNVGDVEEGGSFLTKAQLYVVRALNERRYMQDVDIERRLIDELGELSYYVHDYDFANDQMKVRLFQKLTQALVERMDTQTASNTNNDTLARVIATTLRRAAQNNRNVVDSITSNDSIFPCISQMLVSDDIKLRHIGVSLLSALVRTSPQLVSHTRSHLDAILSLAVSAHDKGVESTNGDVSYSDSDQDALIAVSQRTSAVQCLVDLARLDVLSTCDSIENDAVNSAGRALTLLESQTLIRAHVHKCASAAFTGMREGMCSASFQLLTDSLTLRQRETALVALQTLGCCDITAFQSDCAKLGDICPTWRSSAPDDNYENELADLALAVITRTD
eukprot:m.40016 g.40016  ORF g.40016 m.40016 type:complete len:554 (-) comp10384_c0_seq2:478-2139(-)